MPLPKLFLAQIDSLVGAIDVNTQNIINILEDAEKTDADIVVFPELILCGYPPEDLLLRPSMYLRIERALEQILPKVKDQTVILGYPISDGDCRYNVAGVFRQGKKIAEYRKRKLPNYLVFDEKRYFSAGQDICIFDVGETKVGLTICEDLWHPEPAKETVEGGAELLININSSPYHLTKNDQRDEVINARVRDCRVPIVYLNQVGAQDELVFDGGSSIIDSDGDIMYQAPWFEEVCEVVSLDDSSANQALPSHQKQAPEQEPAAYRALVLGVKDYVNKNGFGGVVLGLSGGIDSALTLAVAADALGADRVQAVMMPFLYTSEMSQTDAADQADRLGVKYSVIPIEGIFNEFNSALVPEFEGIQSGAGIDTTQQNIQARCRGTLLMAISNKTGRLVLTTGNKSEMAVGYATLYGDMAGGFDVLKDVPKLLVYQLSRYRNTLGEVIPERVIERPPSAELAPDQVDEDNLPPYEVLDVILEKYIEEDQSANEIIAAGFDKDVVNKVVRLVDLNEYKRQQAAVGPRITRRGFGRDRRYPITNGWKPGD